jgi:hypothetical protein
MSEETTAGAVRETIGEHEGAQHSEEQATVRAPQVGDIVHYVYAKHNGCYEHVAGSHRPAIVVRKWGNAAENRIQLQVFTDRFNDFPTGVTGDSGLFWATSVPYSAEHEGCSWHWPEGE